MYKIPRDFCILMLAMLLSLAQSCASAPQAATTTAPTSAVSLGAGTEETGATHSGSRSGGACVSPAHLTVSMTEGPYFKPGSPERASLLEPGTPGTRLVLTGRVLTPDCAPVPHAELDFWQANADGQYDNTGYTLRGHQFTDGAGGYQLTTIIPGLYTGRTEHIHVKVQAPGGPVLTTQLFFPGVAQNDTDSIFDPTLVIAIQTTDQGSQGTYDFVVSTQ